MATQSRSGAHDPTLAHDGWTVLVCAPDGSIEGGQAGLYHDDARILSRHVLRLDGEPLEPVAPPVEDGRRWSVVLHRRRAGGTAVGPTLPQDAWAIAIERCVGPGMVERLEVRNHAMVTASAKLSLELAADFCDSLLRGRGGGPPWTTRVSGGGRTAIIRGSARHAGRRDERGVRVRLEHAPGRLARCLRIAVGLEASPAEALPAEAMP